MEEDYEYGGEINYGDEDINFLYDMKKAIETDISNFRNKSMNNMKSSANARGLSITDYEVMEISSLTSELDKIVKAIKQKQPND